MAALSTSNVRKMDGNFHITVGTFTCTTGDAAATLSVQGGWVFPMFFSRDSSGAIQAIPMRYSLSTSGNTTTITIYNQETVTNGDFVIFHR